MGKRMEKLINIARVILTVGFWLGIIGGVVYVLGTPLEGYVNCRVDGYDAWCPVNQH